MISDFLRSLVDFWEVPVLKECVILKMTADHPDMIQFMDEIAKKCTKEAEFGRTYLNVYIPHLKSKILKYFCLWVDEYRSYLSSNCLTEEEQDVLREKISQGQRKIELYITSILQNHPKFKGARFFYNGPRTITISWPFKCLPSLEELTLKQLIETEEKKLINYKDRYHQLRKKRRLF